MTHLMTVVGGDGVVWRLCLGLVSVKVVLVGFFCILYPVLHHTVTLMYLREVTSNIELRITNISE